MHGTYLQCYLSLMKIYFRNLSQLRPNRTAARSNSDQGEAAAHLSRRFAFTEKSQTIDAAQITR